MRSFRSQLGLEMAYSKRARKSEWGRGRGKGGGHAGPSQEEAHGNRYWQPGRGYEDQRRPEAKAGAAAKAKAAGRGGRGRPARGSRCGWTEQDAEDRHFEELAPWQVWRVNVYSDLAQAPLKDLKQLARDHDCKFSMRKDR